MLQRSEATGGTRSTRAYPATVRGYGICRMREGARSGSCVRPVNLLEPCSTLTPCLLPNLLPPISVLCIYTLAPVPYLVLYPLSRCPTVIPNPRPLPCTVSPIPVPYADTLVPVSCLIHYLSPIPALYTHTLVPVLYLVWHPLSLHPMPVLYSLSPA